MQARIWQTKQQEQYWNRVNCLFRRGIRKGDVLECPEGVRHWHGAAPDSWFCQMVIYGSQYRGPGESGEDGPVTDAEYVSLETEEYEGRNVDAERGTRSGSASGGCGSLPSGRETLAWRQAFKSKQVCGI